MKKGFSLIEVLVFTTVLSIFFVSALSLATYMLKTMKVNQHRTLATHFAEEGMEWLRAQKEDSWATYVGLDNSSGTTEYCLNSLDFNTGGDCGTDYALGTPPMFKRKLIMENVPDSSSPSWVKATIMVEWEEGNRISNVALDSTFSALE